ncbi:gp16 protein [Vibrio phage VP585]|uniref:Gp16 protein n=1 Tax=Vibrio phage VP585 TaxID=631719 RepID=D4HTV5_9CAUD|nr:gp16 protein [Vibrio phage VP585]CAX64997.1 gp16 protein [Vibrio phage VP585]
MRFDIQTVQRLLHRIWGAFKTVNIKRILHHLPLDMLRPTVVPFIHRQGPGQPRQQRQRAGIWVPQVLDTNRQVRRLNDHLLDVTL